MRAPDLARFAAAALAGHRLRSGLSLLGVAIGVAAVVLLTALGEGARLYVTSQFESIGTNLMIVVPGKIETTGGIPGLGGAPNDLTIDDAVAVMRQLPEVERVAPVSVGTESVSAGSRRRQVAIIGTTHELAPIRNLHVARGEFLPELEPNRGSPVAVLGDVVARELFPGESALGRVVRIGDWRMRVIGVLEPRGEQLGVDIGDTVMVPVATGMSMFNRTSLFRMLVKVRAHADLDRAQTRLVELLTERHGEEDITCIRQDSVVEALSGILNALTLALAAIAAISLSVAGIGIMNVMMVSVSERTAEIGLLRALGAGKAQILAAFLTEAILLSSAGGVVGLAVGFGAIQVLMAIYPELQATPPVWAVTAALAVAVSVGAVFGVMPARRATRLDPVAALARR